MDHNLTSLFALNIKLDRDDQTIPEYNYAGSCTPALQYSSTPEHKYHIREQYDSHYSVYERNALMGTESFKDVL